ncbi:MAG: TerB family tellurite resistance protein [Planctomycetes bacterium]|nr:TerB family tellurite resistance protein [Planctomycetota bacterium]
MPGSDDGWGLVSASGLRRVYRILCHVAHCDQVLHPSERDLLEQYRTRFGIPPAEAAALEEEGKHKQIRLGRHEHEQRMLMWAMIDVAAADGRLERSEHKRLMKVAGAIGLPQAELVALIRRRFAHERGGLPPRPAGVKTAVIAPYRAGARRDIPDTLAGIPAPADLDGPGAEAPARPIPPTVGPVRAPLAADPSPPRGLDPFARPGLVDPFASLQDDDRPTLTGVGAAEVARRAELPTPVPDDPPTAPSPRGGFGPAAHDTSLSLSPGAIVLLGVNARDVRIDLNALVVGPDFRGFGKVPPGLHWVSVVTSEGPTSLWVDLPGGGVTVKVFEQRTRRLVDAAPQTAERYKALARGGLAGLVTYPYDLAVEWVELTVHLDAQRFPPGLHPTDAALPDPGATRFEAALRGTHRGDGQALLTELSWAFLAGALERHPAALERWLHLLKACFEAPPEVLAADPTLAVLLVDLLVAQLQQMPPGFIDVGVMAGAGELQDALRETGLPHLAEAAARLAAGLR